MIKNIATILTCVFLTSSMFSQKGKDPVLLKIDDEPVYQSEFVRLFGKNQNLQTSSTKESIKEDFNLFIDYKLKLLEAKELKFDTVSSYTTEVSRYRNQLAVPYLNDNKYVDSLTFEAYQRSLKEVKASHILIKAVSDKPKDTLQAYEKISKIREEVLAGADFSEMAEKNSNDPSAKSNKGDLGYFSVFRMVYAFEDQAYNMNVGEVSKVFKTQFGYHILKLYDVRDSKGKVQVAHIMIRDKSDKGRETIGKVYDEVYNGGNFEELAKQYSDDKRSAVNGGKMKEFGLTDLPVPFGEKSFALSEENKYSKPFQTDYGWHIVKLLKKFPNPAFEDAKKGLRQQVKRSGRAKMLGNPVVDRLKKEYVIEVHEEAKNSFDKDLLEKGVDSLTKWLVKIEGKVLTQNDFYDYVKNRRDKKTMDIFDNFVDQEILAYYKANLETSSSEFKNLFEEYKNGLLLFDLMKSQVWDAAQNDSIGLQKYYDLNFETYKSKPSVDALIVRTKDENEALQLKEYIEKTSEIDTIRNYLSSKKNVLVKSGNFEEKAAIFPQDTDFVVGTTKSYKEKEYHVIVKIVKKNPIRQQEYEEVKGKVISDYQNKIQKEWLQKLRKKHKLKLYKRRLKKVKKALQNYSA